MNYSEMTDFEINKAVGEIILEGKWACKPRCAGNQSDSWHYGSVDTFVTPYPALPDYCNSWADAGPIIHENKISLMYDSDASIEPPAEWVLARHVSDRGDGTSYYGHPSEPLRSAMIVFLMIQEKANA